MKQFNRFSSFLAGAATALALTVCLTTALAASGKVSYNFANVSLNGTPKITAGKDITAANGQKIPGSILYTDAAGGKTNYLPIRTISELLEVEMRLRLRQQDHSPEKTGYPRRRSRRFRCPHERPDGRQGLNSEPGRYDSTRRQPGLLLGIGQGVQGQGWGTPV